MPTKKTETPEAMLSRLLKMAESMASAQAKREERQTVAFEKIAAATDVLAWRVSEVVKRENDEANKAARAVARRAAATKRT